LDVNDSLTIIGATDSSGNAASIIQACDPTPNPTCSTGVDKVFSFNQDISSFTNATVSISNLVIRFGHNRGSFGGLQDGFGGGFDFDTGGTTAGTGNANLTVTNCLITDNTTTDGDGGGVAVFNTNSGSGFAHFVDSTIQNNAPMRATSGAAGGGIFVGAPGRIVLDNTQVINNNATQTSPATGNGGGIFTFGQPNPSVSSAIHGGRISGNKAAGDGGGLDIDAGLIVDSGTVISNNQAGTAGGGALNGGNGGGVWYNALSQALSITNATIAGNSAAGGGGTDPGGGGIWNGQGNGETVNISFSRLAGNSAPHGSNVRMLGGGTGQLFTAADNWWGTNSPAATIDTAGTTCPGTANVVCFMPYIVLTNTASPNPIKVNQTTTLTADFLHLSNGSSLTASQIPVLLGLDVAWGHAVKGALSNTQATIQSNGMATATFTASAAGTGSADATVDQGTATGSFTISKANTTTAITSQSSATTVTGESFIVDFHVNSETGSTPTAPTGSVTVGDGTNSCSGSINGSGDGNCTLTLFTAGSKSLTATYGGDGNFNTSPASAGVAHTVNKADTTTTIGTITTEPSVTGQTVTIPYTVTVNSPGSGTPTGNVTVSDGGSNSCTGTVADGACTIAFPAAGTYTLTAIYQGDANYNASPASAGVSHQVNKADTTTTITSDLPDPSDPNQSVTVDYTVTVNSPGAGTPTGNVTVSDGTHSCTGTVTAGTCDIAFPTPGSVTLTAIYDGDSNFNGSSSQGVSHTVNKFHTTTTITAPTPDPSIVGQAVTVQYSVTSSGGTPTGNVTVSDGTDSCTDTVATGQCDLTFTSTGTKTLTATYAGDSNFEGSTSAGVSHTVDPATPVLTTQGSETAGGLVGTAILSDTATLSDGYMVGAGSPVPTITFSLVAPNGSTVYTETQTVTGTGSYSTTGTGTGSAVATQVGTYYWNVSYAGNATNSAVSHSGQSDLTEQLTTIKATPALTTQGSQTANGVVGTAVLSDTATLAGGFMVAAGSPAPTLTFSLIGPDNTTVYTETQTVTGTGSYTTTGTGTGSELATQVGTYYWNVSYAGNAANNAVSHSGQTDTNEQLTTILATPALTTQGSETANGAVGTAVLSDTATLSGGFMVATGTPAPTLTFTLIAPDNTTVYTETQSVTGAGNYTTTGSGSGSTSATQVGTYRWNVSYNANGSPFDNSATHTGQSDTAEQLTTIPAAPALTTQASETANGTVGTALLSDTALLAGGFHVGAGSPAPTLTFQLIAPNGSTVYTETQTVTATGNYSTTGNGSGSEVASQVGTYYWNVSYSGNATNFSVTDNGQTDPAEQLTTVAATPGLATTPGGTVIVGGGAKLTDSATLSGGFGTLQGTVTFSLFAPGVTPNSTDSNNVYSDTVPVSGTGTYTTATGTNPGGFLPTAAGTYQWVVVYSGDPTNNPVTSPFGSEPETANNQAQTSLSTTASPTGSLTLGTTAPTLTDSAMLSGGNSPTGSINFTLKLGGTTVYTASDPVSGNKTYSASFTLPTTGTVTGTYTWSATYSGDTNNTESSDQGGSSEQVTVQAASPRVATTPTPAVATIGAGLSDSAKLSGGYVPTGSITFTLLQGVTPGTCTGSTTTVFTKTVTVTGNGTYTTPSAYTATALGSYAWVVTYTGDGNNTPPSAGSCEPVTVQYGVTLLYKPPAKASGGSVPIKVELVNVAGQNQSSSTLKLQALCVIPATATPQTCASAVPGFTYTNQFFTFMAGLDTGGGYQYNVKTTGLKGTYKVLFRTTTEPTNVYHQDAGGTGATFSVS
jgi:hypothetical protein